ncbi:MAG: DUF3592 domain-containing protein [Ruminococcus sp.]|nr:DUF3592 domain-containing protein [Ruminococcus sp.]
MRTGFSARISARKLKTVLIVAALIVGAAFAAFGTVILTDLSTLKRLCTAETKGVVTELREETKALHRGSTTSYYPTFSYEYGGKQYTYSSRIGSSSPAFTEGEELVIMVDPDSPERIYVPKEDSGWTLGIVLCVIGAGFLAAGLIPTVIGIRSRRKAHADETGPDR